MREQVMAQLARSRGPYLYEIEERVQFLEDEYERNHVEDPHAEHHDLRYPQILGGQAQSECDDKDADRRHGAHKHKVEETGTAIAGPVDDEEVVRFGVDGSAPYFVGNGRIVIEVVEHLEGQSSLRINMYRDGHTD